MRNCADDAVRSECTESEVSTLKEQMKSVTRQGARTKALAIRLETMRSSGGV